MREYKGFNKLTGRINSFFPKALTILNLLFLTHLLLSQTANLRIKHYSLEEGISHRLVTKVMKDDRGFIWLATPNGLNRFDGYDFLHFSAYQDASRKVSGNYVGDIVTHQSGKLVIFYKDKEHIFDFFDPHTFSIQPIDLKEKLGVNGKIIDAFAEPGGEVFIYWQEKNNGIISKIDFDGTKIDLYRFPKKSSKLDVQGNLVKRDNGDFVVFDEDLGFIKVNDSGVVALQVKSGLDFRNTDIHITYLKEDKMGRLWLSIAEYLGVFLLDEDVFKNFSTPLGEVSIARLWEDNSGNLLFAQTDGIIFPAVQKVFLLDRVGRWRDFSFMTQIAKYLIDLESDNFNGLILATCDTGLKIVDNKNSIIQTYLNEPSENGARNRIIRGITSNGKNKIYITQEKEHWFELDALDNQLRSIDLKDKRTGNPIKINCSKKLYYDSSSHYLWGFTCDKDFGGSWLLKVNPENGETERFRFTNKIRSFTKGKDGNFWIISAVNTNDTELYVFNPVTNKYTLYRTPEGQNSLKNAFPLTIQTYGDNELLIGTLDGLYRINTTTHTLDIYGVEDGLSSNTIEVILKISEDELLLGTSRGLNLFNLKTRENVVYLSKDGLSSNHVYGIEPAAENTYWVSTIMGLTHFNLHNKSSRTFFKEDGLTHNEFNRFAHFNDNNGRYYFGGVNGINAFDEKTLLVSKAAPKVILTKMEYFKADVNKTVSIEKDLSKIQAIKLGPNDKYLHLSFMLPDYNSPEKNQFKVKLEGLDEEWQLLRNQNHLLYNTLPDGAYQLKIVGANTSGNWGTEPLIIDIVKSPKFYKTIHFWILITFLILVLVQLINQFKFNQKLRAERLRTKLSSDLHDEVSGLLAGIAMQSELMSMDVSAPHEKEQLENISQKSRAAMSRMGDVLWSIDARNNKLDDLLLRMTSHAAEILDPLNFNWRFDVFNLNRHQEIPVLKKENLYFIFKEAINNVAKHSSGDDVVVSIGNESNHFLLKVKDNGEKKVKTDKFEKEGQGLKNMKMRAEKIGAILNYGYHKGFFVHLKMSKI